jgi:hypothetical protein
MFHYREGPGEGWERTRQVRIPVEQEIRLQDTTNQRIRIMVEYKPAERTGLKMKENRPANELQG